MKKLSMILVVNSTVPESDKEIVAIVNKHSKNYKVKSKNLTLEAVNMVIEINVNAESELVHDVMKINGVTSASILSHDGEITA